MPLPMPDKCCGTSASTVRNNVTSVTACANPPTINSGDIVNVPMCGHCLRT
jgi:hypothetical protein